MVASKCTEYQEDLVSLAYGQLDPECSERLEKHLAECAACRLEIEGLKAVRCALLDDSPADIRLPREEDFVARVMTAVRQKPAVAANRSTERLSRGWSSPARTSPGRFRFRLLASGAAAAALMIGVGWWFLRSRDTGGAGAPPTVKEPEEPVVAVVAERSVEELLAQAERAESPEQVRGLSVPLSRAADLEASRPDVSLEKWSYLTLAESLAWSADRDAYRPALACALKLAVGSEGRSGATEPAPALQALRDDLVAGRTANADALLAKLPADLPESPVLAGRVLSRRIREALSAEPLTDGTWERVREMGTLEFAEEKEEGLAFGVACIVRGDLAAAALNYDVAVKEWRAAEDHLAADRPELAASLALRAACAMLLPRGQAREAAVELKRLGERHGRTAAAALCRGELSGLFSAEARAEAGRNRAFFAAMGIPIDVRRQTLTPLSSGKGLEVGSVPVADYDLKNMTILLQFPRPLPLSAPGRCTVVSGQVRLLARSAEAPMEVLICAQTDEGDVAVAPLETPASGLTYHLRLAIWEAADKDSKPGLQASILPEGWPAERVVQTGAPAGAAGRGKEGACAVQCLSKNVARMELSNFQLRTDVEMTAPEPRGTGTGADHAAGRETTGGAGW